MAVAAAGLGAATVAHLATPGVLLVFTFLLLFLHIISYNLIDKIIRTVILDSLNV